MESSWTTEMTADLARLWNDGHSTAEIGRRLGVTKNAVVGKAHRLHLPPRPSPLKFKPLPERPTSVVLEFSTTSCSWPIGHPGDRGFSFCGKRCLDNKPYCAEHAAVAYIKPKAKTSNAA